MVKTAAILAFAIFLLFSQSCQSENSTFHTTSVVQDVKLFYFQNSWKQMVTRAAEQIVTCNNGFHFSQVKPKDSFMFAKAKSSLKNFPIGIVFLQQVWNITLTKTNNTLYFMHPIVIERYVNYCLKDGEGVAMIYAKEHFGEPTDTFKAAVESLLKATFGDIKKI